MGGKVKVIKAAAKRLKEYTNAMTKNSTNNMSKDGTIDRMIDKKSGTLFDPVVRQDLTKLAKRMGPNTNDTAVGMAVGAAGMYGAMKAKENKKVKLEKKPRKAFMNTKVRD
jgi:hypothetical protein